MSDCMGAAYFGAVAIFALLTAAVVIVAAGYFTSTGLLFWQVAFIAGPTFLPLALLSRRGSFVKVSRVAVALFITAGWAFVVYVDTRPYTGGGASFALLFGWFGCAIATLATTVIVAIDNVRRRSSQS